MPKKGRNWVLVSPENAPPKPWLMSTTGEIQREERSRDEWKQRWAARLRVESSIDEKLGWIEEQERAFDSLDLGWQKKG